MKNVHLITGGNGFLGNMIANRLLEKGERVRVLDIWDFPGRSADIEYVHCDIMDRDGVRRAMQDVSVVHHNAALVPLTKSSQGFRKINRDGSRIVAEEAVGAGVDAFIYMSSSAIFGKGKSPITQATALNPIEPYGASKLAGEAAVREVVSESGMPLIVVRPRTIIGNGRMGIFQILFDWIGEGRRIYIIGPGDNLFQFVHVHDLIDFYMLALAGQKPGDYNVGTDRFSTLKEDLQALIRHAGTTSRVVGLPVASSIMALGLLDKLGISPLTKWHYNSYHIPFHFDVSEPLAMGWKPRYSNVEMMTEAYDWYRENPDTREAEHGASVHRKSVAAGFLNLLRRLS